MTVKRPLFIAGAAILVVAMIAGVAVMSIRQAMPHNPLDGHDQLVFVVSRSEMATEAKLVMYDRDGDTWRFHDTAPAVVGRNGMAWGRGLHRSRAIDGEEVKREGDGCAPKGAFELIEAYGYPPDSMVTIRFPYTQTSPAMACIDDVRSRYYTMLVNSDSLWTDPSLIPSHEDLLRDDNLYKYLIVVGHNTVNPKPGAGSCIFIHVWAGSESSTAGCTAVSEGAMLRLLSWLDPAKKPILVQLTRTSYRRLQEEWGLPDVTI